MQKNSVTFLLSILVLCIFGAFFRWLEVLNAFDNTTGLHAYGSITTAIVIVYSIIAIIVIRVFCSFYLKIYIGSVESAQKALYARTAYPILISYLLAAIIIIAAIITMLTSNYNALPTFRRIFGALAIFAGLSIPFTFCRTGGSVHPLAEIACLILPLFCCVWLVFSYRLNAENPVIFAYAPEIFAVCSLTYGYYNIAACFYGRAKSTSKVLFSTLMGTYFPIMTLADPRPFAMQMIFIAGAASMLIYSVLIFSNLKLKGVHPENAK